MTNIIQNDFDLNRCEFVTDEMLRRGIYGDRVFDGSLHRCSVCGEHAAFAHSVRIRQDIRCKPQCFNCLMEPLSLEESR